MAIIGLLVAVHGFRLRDYRLAGGAVFLLIAAWLLTAGIAVRENGIELRLIPPQTRSVPRAGVEFRRSAFGAAIMLAGRGMLFPVLLPFTSRSFDTVLASVGQPSWLQRSPATRTAVRVAGLTALAAGSRRHSGDQALHLIGLRYGRVKWTARERRVLDALKTPADVQRYLDELRYDERGGARSPRRVMESGKAQCYSGALFAAAALRELGFGARIMWMDAVEDDGHCIALYEVNGLWGSIAKSNFTGIRSREPVYTYEALGLSYFDFFFNQFGKRTMRAFTVPIDLEPFEKRNWRFSGGDLLYVDRAIDTAERAWKLPRPTERKLSRMSDDVMTAGLMGSNPAGLWRPE